MKNTKLTIGLSLLGLLIIFTLQNAAVVDISFLFWTFSISRALLLFLVFAIGLLSGWILNSLIANSNMPKEK